MQVRSGILRGPVTIDSRKLQKIRATLKGFARDCLGTKESFEWTASDYQKQWFVPWAVENESEFAYSCHIAGVVTAFGLRRPPRLICWHRKALHTI